MKMKQYHNIFLYRAQPPNSWLYLEKSSTKVSLHSPFTMVRPRTTVLPLFTTMLGQTHREVIASTKFSRLACKWSRDQEIHHNISKNRSLFSSAKCKKLSRSVHLQQEIKLEWPYLSYHMTFIVTYSVYVCDDDVIFDGKNARAELI